ncbi:DUF3592 domain-containing protein [Rhodococcus aerolatus]
MARRVLLTAATVVTVLAFLLVVAAWRDDNAIEAHRGVATADVLSVGRVSAAISFTTPDGVTRTPELGVLYPTGLAADQRIEVEYSTQDPDLVRVQGRDARLAVVPALSVAVVAWLLAGVGLLVVRRLGRAR